MKINIDSRLKELTPNFNIASITFKAKVHKTNKLDKYIEDTINDIKSRFVSTEELLKDNLIDDARRAYKTYKKDPSRYKLAVESLYRRIIKDKGLYRINDLVDLGNILSLETTKSVAVLDKDSIKGDILIRLGHKDEEYEGIGRGKLNIENIPLYADEISAFGSTTSDTLRTSIKDTTTNVLIFIISFSGLDILKNDVAKATSLLDKFIDYSDISIEYIS